MDAEEMREQRTSIRNFCKRDSIGDRTAAAKLPPRELHTHPMAFQDAVRRVGLARSGGVETVPKMLSGRASVIVEGKPVRSDAIEASRNEGPVQLTASTESSM